MQFSSVRRHKINSSLMPFLSWEKYRVNNFQRSILPFVDLESASVIKHSTRSI